MFATPPPPNKSMQDYFDDDGISSVRTDLTTIPSSNVRRVVVHCSVAFNVCDFDSLVNEIPEKDRREFVAYLLRLVEVKAERRRTLRPRIIERMFFIFVRNYNGNLDIGHLGQQIENYYNFQDTHHETVALIRARYHELAAASVGRQFQALPPAPDVVPSANPTLSSSTKQDAKLAAKHGTNPSAPTGPGGEAPPGTGCDWGSACIQTAGSSGFTARV